MRTRQSISFRDITNQVTANRTYLMGIAMLLVILYHCGVFPFRYFGYWGVDIFLFLSGFGICFSLSKNDSMLRFYLKRIQRIMPAAIVCGIVFFEIGCVHGVKSLAPFGLNLWYIRTILFFYLMSPLIYLVVKKWKLPACLLIILFSEIMSYVVLVVCPGGYVLGWSLPRLPVYILGMMLPFYSNDGKGEIKLWLLFVLALLGMGVSASVGVHQMLDWRNYVWYMFMPSVLLTPAIVGGVLLFSTFLKRVLPVCVLKFLGLTGALSLELYLIHESLLKNVTFVNAYVGSCRVSQLICIFVTFFLAGVLNKCCNEFLKLIRYLFRRILVGK